MYIHRLLDINALLTKKSHFLFGPRGVGKSSLIAHGLPDNVMIIDLLKSDVYLRLSENPSQLEAMIELQQSDCIVIDEIQRIPELLNEVHRLIETKQLRFLLTGSSARKLRQQGVNLLAGRARQAELLPLTYIELPQFDLDRYLLYGGLPMVVLSDEPEEDLDAYVYTYLEQEIKAEALVKRLPAFSRFLRLSALTSGTTLNYSTLATDAGVTSVTLAEYYQILEDTFIGFQVLPWQHSVKRKAVATARFYYFDLGVRHRLARVHSLTPGTDLYGQAFEHFIALELRAYLSYSRRRLPLCFWRTTQGHEVDFIVGETAAIEVKSARKVTNKHLKNLKLLMEENNFNHYFLVSKDPIAAQYDQIKCLPWQQFLRQLWADQLF